ncbi:MAG: hypothetical protein SPI62_03135 [Candidatus Enteromonas sp.]|nr:rod shape-determining protein [bacterium]MDY6100842.1 hypothetical protein [Candidatus Enteromonas sp.]
METKPLACFDISHSSIKLLIGYCLDGKPVVLYKKEASVAGLVEKGGGVSENRDELIRIFSSFSKFDEPELKLRGSISEICLALPPIGLKIYEHDESTTCASSDKKISRVDISNVIAKVQNEEIPSGSEVVDIIPVAFQLNSGEVYANPPLGMVSSSLGVKAMIHTLPNAIALDYKNLANRSQYRIKKVCVAPYCQAALFALDPESPANYILVDMGSRMTSLTLIGGREPYRSAHFFLGGDDLSECIASRLGVDSETAEKLKKVYGYDSRPFLYSPSLAEGTDPQNGLPTKISQKALNEAIEEYFASFFTHFQAAWESMLRSDQERLAPFPILLTGGASELRGLDELFAKRFPNRKLLFPKPASIGGRDPRYSVCLGLLAAASHYTGSLEDNYHGVAHVDRLSEPQGKKTRKEKKASASTEDAL